jgi:hypothetical protein
MPILPSLNAVPDNVLWEQGILFVDNTTPFAASTGGGMRFEENPEWRNIAEDIDGVHHKLAGADVRVGGNPTISGTIVQLTPTILGQLLPGAASNTVTSVTTVTPVAAGELLDAATDYLENVRAVWPLQGATGGYLIVHFPVAKVVTWTPRGGAKGEKGGIDITIEARGLAADIASGTAPYKLYHSNVASTGHVA